MDPGSDSTRHADRSSSGRRSRRWHVRSTERRTGQLQQQQTLGISETVYVPPDEALDVERDVSVQKWKASAKSRPLKFLVAGRGGVGKSSLVNNILDSELDSSSAERAREGRTGNATTQAVCRHTGSKHGIQVIAYDTPGFQDLELAEENILAKLVDETDCMLDVCLYCASLDGMRISQEDRRICSLLTNAFKPKLWEKAIFVLTFANTVSDKVVESDYNELVDHYKNNLKGCLTKAGVPAEIVNNIPFCTAGYRDPYELKHEGCRIHWQDRLYVEIIKKADSEVTPALLKLRWGPEAVSYAVSACMLIQICMHIYYSDLRYTCMFAECMYSVS